MSSIIAQTWQCPIDATVTAEKFCSMLQGLVLDYAEGAAERAQQSLTLQALPAHWKLPVLPDGFVTLTGPRLNWLQR